MRRNEPLQDDFIDEFLGMFEHSELSPQVRRLRPGGINPDDVMWRQMLADIRECAEGMAPLARLLVDKYDE